ncbi:MAG: methionyl-tRNA formyltransferase [Actinobacteria bacterium]|jgi:methionyl-tRNA formyltransferase|nr:methionyl-tRNA formyltransferase [Actinomycetota bacterium]
MRCVFAGTPEVAAVSLRAVLASRHEVTAVVTRPDAAAGRGRRTTASPVADVARGFGIEVLAPQSARDPDFARRLVELEPDCVPIVAYGGLIPGDLLSVPRLGWVNLHFSLLPSWRGAAPVQHAIWHGDDITGATTFLLDEGMDTGPVFGTVTSAIGLTDSAGDVLAALAGLGSELLVATLDALEDGAVQAVPQRGEPSYAPKISVEDARVRWDLPAVGVDRQIRACTPVPGAWTMLGEERVRLMPVAIASSLVDEPILPLPAGQLRVTRRAVWVGTATTPVLLGDVRPAGKRAMAAADWARGARLTDGVVVT